MRRAVVLSALSNYTNLIVNFITVVIASRLLTPDEAGAYAAAIGFVVMVSTLIEFNIVNYGVQIEDLTAKHLSAMFGLSSFICVSAVSFLILLSHHIASFLGGEELYNIISPMVAVMLLYPFCVPSLSVLRRQANYMPVAVVSMAAGIVRCISSVVLIHKGFGAIGLAYGYILSKVIEIFVIWLWGYRDYFVWPSTMKWADVARFGGVNTLAQGAGVLGFSAAELLTAHSLGLYAAGIYNRGSVLTGVYRTGIEKSVFPIALAALSRAREQAADVVTKSLSHAMVLMAGIGWPVFAVLAILSGELVSVLFGPSWSQSADIAKTLSIACGIYVLSSITPSALMALRMSRTLLVREVGIQAFRIILVLGAAQMSINAVAWAIAATYLLSVVVDWTILMRRRILSITHSIDVVKSGLQLAIPTGMLCFLTRYISKANGASDLTTLTVASLVSGVGFVGSAILFKHRLWKEVLPVLDRIDQLWKRRKSESG